MYTKLIDSNRKNLLPYYPKEYALRELTQLYSFAGLKIVHDNSDKNQKQTIFIICSPHFLETKNKEKNPTKTPRNKQQTNTSETKKKQKIRRKNFTTKNKIKFSTTTIIATLKSSTKQLQKLQSTI